MSNDGKLLEAQSRALRAKQLMDDELLTEAFKSLEDSYVAAWRTSKVGDELAREKLFLAINVVGKVRDHILHIVEDGKLAAAELRELADAAERKQRWPDVRG